MSSANLDISDEEGDSRLPPDILHITVLVCTRRRPELLQTCLNALAGQEVSGQFEFDVIIVENDDIPRSLGIVEAFADRIEIRHVLETNTGIVMARNRALDEAMTGAPDWIAFTDDDEVPAPDWLRQFAKAAQTWPEAAVFMGARRRAKHGIPTSRWIHSAPLQTGATGTRARMIATANALIRSDMVSAKGMNLRFLEEFNLTGEEDTEFFQRLRRKGGLVLFAADAITEAEQHPSRAGFAYRFTRAKRQSCNLGRIRVLQFGPVLGMLKTLSRLLRDILMVLATGTLGTLSWPFSRRIGTGMIARALWHSARVAGTVLYFSGRRLEPYRTIDGS